MVGNRKKYPRRCVKLNVTKISGKKQGVMTVSDVSSGTDDNKSDIAQNYDVVAEQSSDSTTAARSDSDYVSPIENLAEMPTSALPVCGNIEQVVARPAASETNVQISVSATSVAHAHVSTTVTSIAHDQISAESSVTNAQISTNGTSTEHSQLSTEPSTSNRTPVTSARELPSATNMAYADHNLSIDPLGHIPGASQSRNMHVGAAGTCTKIKDITENDCVAVWGVVKFVYPPTRSKGSDWVLNFGLVDDSVDISKDEKLRCHLFLPGRNLCESVKKAGQIVRLSGVKIIKYNGQYQAVATGATKIEVWHGDIDGSTLQISGGICHTLTDTDLEKLQEMRVYWQSIRDSILPPVPTKKLQEVRPNDHATVYCQIVGICHMRSEACLLRVWDGTILSSDMKGREIIFSQAERQCYSEQSNLASLSKDLTIDAFLYSEHATRARELNLQAGDFVKLVKLHCKPFRLTQTNETIVDFIMHRGSWDDKEVVKLNNDEPEVAALQRLSAETVLDQASQRSSGSSTIIKNSGNGDSVGNVNNSHEDKISRDTLTSNHAASLIGRTECEQTEEKEKVTPHFSCQENNEVLASSSQREKHIEEVCQTDNNAAVRDNSSNLCSNHDELCRTVDDKVPSHMQPQVLSPWLLEIICNEVKYCKNTYNNNKVSK